MQHDYVEFPAVVNVGLARRWPSATYTTLVRGNRRRTAYPDGGAPFRDLKHYRFFTARSEAGVFGRAPLVAAAHASIQRRVALVRRCLRVRPRARNTSATTNEWRAGRDSGVLFVLSTSVRHPRPPRTELAP